MKTVEQKKPLGATAESHGSHEDLGLSQFLTTRHNCSGGAGIVNQLLLSGTLDLAHGAFEAFGKLAVVLADLGVTPPGSDRIVSTEVVANLGTICGRF